MNGNKRGFTLIEVLVAASISVVVLGAALAVMIQLRNASSGIKMRAAARTEVQRAVFAIGRELGQASKASFSPLPSASIRYKVVVDADGNGCALDANGQVEWSAERFLQRDVDDANHDGLGAEQLVLVNGSQVTVLANGLAPDEPGEGASVRPGLWFEQVPGSVRVMVRTLKTSRPDQRKLFEALAETIAVRNP